MVLFHHFWQGLLNATETSIRKVFIITVGLKGRLRETYCEIYGARGCVVFVRDAMFYTPVYEVFHDTMSWLLVLLPTYGRSVLLLYFYTLSPSRCEQIFSETSAIIYQYTLCHIYLYSSSGPSRPVVGRTLPLPFTVSYRQDLHLPPMLANSNFSLQ